MSKRFQPFIQLYALCLLAFLVSFCVQPPDYPDEPVIEFVRLNKSSIAQGNSGARPDTLAVIFSFTDGDGNIGFDNDSIDVFLTDSRDDFINRFKLPVIPDQGSGNGISGEVTIKLPNTPFNICCTFPDGSTACQQNDKFPVDTFSYTIQIRDRDFNVSNKIQTDLVTILCN